MALVRLIARPMLSTMFITGGVSALKHADQMAARAQPVTDKLQPLIEKATANLPVTVTPTLMVRANGVIHVVAGSMLATGRSPRLSALVLAATMVPTTLAGHRYWEESDPGQRINQRIHFFKNLSMMGGLLLASVDTEGRPSLAWRARRQAKQAPRQARQAARQAKRKASSLTPG